MGYSTTAIDIKDAKHISRTWPVVSASCELYFNGRRYWQRDVSKAEVKDDHNTIFFTLKNGDFVEVEKQVK